MRSLCAAKSAKGVGGRHVYSSAQGCDRVMMRGLLEHMPPPPPFGFRQRLLKPPHLRPTARRAALLPSPGRPPALEHMARGG